MVTSSTQQVTQLLVLWSEGDQSALEKLTPLIQGELRRLARYYMAGERNDHTLQPTALVNEAYIRLIDWKTTHWKNRAHFIGVAAQLMRHILVDFARSHRRAKRGGGAVRLSLDEALVVSPEKTPDLLAIDDALTTLATLDSRQSKVVELHFFGGLSWEEVAEVLKVSVGTVRRDWSLAKIWIYRQLTGQERHDT
jgi:RNA polymerase sigma-70 factor, ECF subfamily